MGQGYFRTEGENVQVWDTGTTGHLQSETVFLVVIGNLVQALEGLVDLVERVLCYRLRKKLPWVDCHSDPMLDSV